jgi:hypothetical protein
MTTQQIIDQATADGLLLALAEDGSLQATGDDKVVDRWRQRLRRHKTEIINLLAAEKPGGAIEATRPPLPGWCNRQCERFHQTMVPEIGTIMWCCVEDDETHWRRDRIDTMSGCPLTQENQL